MDTAKEVSGEQKLEAAEKDKEDITSNYEESNAGHQIFKGASTKTNLSCNRGVKLVITTSQQTCFASGLADYALLLCRKFAAKLPHQVCHDKLISRKIKLAASVHAIWEASYSTEDRIIFC
ncbi:hypothetical protein AVEN_165958-1 [Araneus ventricosus]|uniref:Uncharacterized protein n=2 Tax=Araneus ventricosus TaxID=182803 RepID=A0A4Y2MIC6_ARAVE|nr:hypothetical protein AVEN_165958-1 [Araneus ventricosus]